MSTITLRDEIARSAFERREYSSAARALEEILVADDPADPYVRLLLARTLQRQSRHAEASPHASIAEALGANVSSTVRA
jgi:cytochrome c-type biogenesis protein CcmH/NrfG